MEAVDVRPEAAPLAEEARHLPQVREQLLDLFVQPVDVPARHRLQTYRCDYPWAVQRWTRFVLRHRVAVLCSGSRCSLAGGFASSRLAPLLSNTFTVPGTDSEQRSPRARASTSATGPTARSPSSSGCRRPRPGDARAAAARRRPRRGGRADREARPRCGRPAPRHLRRRRLDARRSSKAKARPTSCRARVGRPPGVEQRLRHRRRPIQHDLDPIFNQDLMKGEPIAIPIALLVLLAVFGLSCAVTIPFIFAACTITATLGILYGIAHLAETPTYIDEPRPADRARDRRRLLAAHRLPLPRGARARARARTTAVVRTMETAGRVGRLLRASRSRSASRC